MPLFDSNAEVEVFFDEGNITGSLSQKAAFLVAGVKPNNSASFLKASSEGDLTITGSIQITESVPLTIGSFLNTVTGAVRIVATNVTQSVTGSVFVFNNSTTRLWTTGAVATIPTGIQQVTGTVGITSINSPININNFPVTQSVYVGQISPSAIQNITGVVEVTSIASPIHQGASGTISNSWYVTPTNGTGVIGDTQTTPIWISGSTFIFNNPTTPTWITGSATINSVAAPVTVTQGASGSLPWKTDQDELPTFIVGVSGVQIGNNKNMLSILNAHGSNVIIKLRKIQIMNVQITNVTGITAIFSFLKVGNHSGGTIVNAVAHDSSYTTSSFVSTRTDSTITGSVQSLFRMLRATDERSTAGALDSETFEYMFSQTFGDYSLPWKTRPITLHAGEGFAIRQTQNSTAGTFDIYFMFTQEGPV